MKVHVKQSRVGAGYDLHTQTTMDGRTVRLAPWVGVARKDVRGIVIAEAEAVRFVKSMARENWAAQVKSGGRK